MIDGRLYRKMLNAGFPDDAIDRALELDAQGELDIDYIKSITNAMYDLNKSHYWLANPSWVGKVKYFLNKLLFG